MKRETLNENIKKMYGKIMSICDEKLYDRLQRLPDFVDVLGEKDAARLWDKITSLVCYDGAEGEQDE